MKTQPKADCINSFILPDPLLSLDTFSEHLAKGGIIRDMGGPAMAAIFFLVGPFILLQMVRGTIHGVTGPFSYVYLMKFSKS